VGASSPRDGGEFFFHVFLFDFSSKTAKAMNAAAFRLTRKRPAA